MTGSGHLINGSGPLDGHFSTRTLTVSRLRPGTGLPVAVSGSDGSGHSISGRRSAQGGRLGQNCAPQSCKKRNSGLFRWGSPLAVMTGSGHLINGSGPLDGHFSTRTLTVSRLRPGTGLPVAVSGSDGSGHSISGRRSAQGGRLGQNCAPQSCKKRNSGLFRWGSPLAVMTGSGHLINGSGPLDGHFSTRTLTVSRLRPGTGLPVAVSGSDGSGHSISGRRSAQGGRLGQNCAPQSCKKRNSGLFRWGSPLAVMTGSGHLINGSGPLDGHFSTRTLTVSRLRPGTGLPVAVSGSDGSGHSISGRRSAQGGRLGQNCAPQSCKKRNSGLFRWGSPLAVMTGSGHLINGSGPLDGHFSTRTLTVSRLRPGTGLPVAVSGSDGSGHSISGRRSAQGGRLGQNCAPQSCKKRNSGLFRWGSPLAVMTGSGHLINGSGPLDGHFSTRTLTVSRLRPGTGLPVAVSGSDGSGHSISGRRSAQGGRLGQNCAPQSCKKRNSGLFRWGSPLAVMTGSGHLINGSGPLDGHFSTRTLTVSRLRPGTGLPVAVSGSDGSGHSISGRRSAQGGRLGQNCAPQSCKKRNSGLFRWGSPLAVMTGSGHLINGSGPLDGHFSTRTLTVSRLRPGTGLPVAVSGSDGSGHSISGRRSAQGGRLGQNCAPQSCKKRNSGLFRWGSPLAVMTGSGHLINGSGPLDGHFSTRTLTVSRLRPGTGLPVAVSGSDGSGHSISGRRSAQGGRLGQNCAPQSCKKRNSGLFRWGSPLAVMTGSGHLINGSGPLDGHFSTRTLTVSRLRPGTGLPVAVSGSDGSGHSISGRRSAQGGRLGQNCAPQSCKKRNSGLFRWGSPLAVMTGSGHLINGSGPLDGHFSTRTLTVSRLRPGTGLPVAVSGSDGSGHSISGRRSAQGGRLGQNCAPQSCKKRNSGLFRWGSPLAVMTGSGHLINGSGPLDGHFSTRTLTVSRLRPGTGLPVAVSGSDGSGHSISGRRSAQGGRLGQNCAPQSCKKRNSGLFRWGSPLAVMTGSGHLINGSGPLDGHFSTRTLTVSRLRPGTGLPVAVSGSDGSGHSISGRRSAQGGRLGQNCAPQSCKKRNSGLFRWGSPLAVMTGSGHLINGSGPLDGHFSTRTLTVSRLRPGTGLPVAVSGSDGSGHSISGRRSAQGGRLGQNCAPQSCKKRNSGLFRWGSPLAVMTGSGHLINGSGPLDGHFSTRTLTVSRLRPGTGLPVAVSGSDGSGHSISGRRSAQGGRLGQNCAPQSCKKRNSGLFRWGSPLAVMTGSGHLINGSGPLDGHFSTRTLTVSRLRPGTGLPVAVSGSDGSGHSISGRRSAQGGRLGQNCAPQSCKKRNSGLFRWGSPLAVMTGSGHLINGSGPLDGHFSTRTLTVSRLRPGTGLPVAVSGSDGSGHSISGRRSAQGGRLGQNCAPQSCKKRNSGLFRWGSPLAVMTGSGHLINGSGPLDGHFSTRTLTVSRLRPGTGLPVAVSGSDGSGHSISGRRSAQGGRLGQNCAPQSCKKRNSGLFRWGSPLAVMTGSGHLINGSGPLDGHFSTRTLTVSRLRPGTGLPVAVSGSDGSGHSISGRRSAQGGRLGQNCAPQSCKKRNSGLFRWGSPLAVMTGSGHLINGSGPLDGHFSTRTLTVSRLRPGTGLPVAVSGSDGSGHSISGRRSAQGGRLGQNCAPQSCKKRNSGLFRWGSPLAVMTGSGHLINGSGPLDGHFSTRTLTVSRLRPGTGLPVAVSGSDGSGHSISGRRSAQGGRLGQNCAPQSCKKRNSGLFRWGSPLAVMTGSGHLINGSGPLDGHFSTRTLTVSRLRPGTGLPVAVSGSDGSGHSISGRRSAQGGRLGQNCAPQSCKKRNSGLFRWGSPLAVMTGSGHLINGSGPLDGHFSTRTLTVSRLRPGTGLPVAVSGSDGSGHSISGRRSAQGGRLGQNCAPQSCKKRNSGLFRWGSPLAVMTGSGHLINGSGPLDGHFSTRTLTVSRLRPGTGLPVAVSGSDGSGHSISGRRSAQGGRLGQNCAPQSCKKRNSGLFRWGSPLAVMTGSGHLINGSGPLDGHFSTRTLTVSRLRPGTGLPVAVSGSDGSGHSISGRRSAQGGRLGQNCAPQSCKKRNSGLFRWGSPLAVMTGSGHLINGSGPLDGHFSTRTLTVSRLRPGTGLPVAVSGSDGSGHSISGRRSAQGGRLGQNCAPQSCKKRNSGLFRWGSPLAVMTGSGHLINGSGPLDGHFSTRTLTVSRLRPGTGLPVAVSGSDGSGHSISGRRSAQGGRLGQNCAPQSCKKRNSGLFRWGSPLAVMTGSGHLINGSGPLDGHFSTRTLTVSRLRPGTGLPVAVSGSDGSGHSISGRRSAQGGRLGQNCAPQSCKKRNSGLFRWGSPLAVMTGSGHLINGSGPLDGHFSTRTLTVSRLRPGTGLPVAVSGSDGSGHSISGRRSAQGGRLGQNCAPQSCKKRNSGLFRWGSPLAVMTGSGHLINGSGPLDGHFSTRTLTVSRLRPGTGLPVAVSGSDGSGHSISGRRSAQGGRLGQNCAPQSCKKRNSGLFRWGSPLAVMTGSGHLINGSGPLDGHFSTRTLTVSRLRPGTGLPVAVSGSDGSGHSISGRRSAQGGRLGQNCAPQSCKKRNSGLFRWGSPLAVMTGSGHLINGSGPLDGHFSTRTLTVSRLRPGTGLPVAVSGSDGSGHSISGRRSAQGGRLGQNCAPQSCKKRNSGLFRWGSPLAVMTGSGHLINGSGPLDGHFSTRTLTVSRLRPGTGLPVAVSGSDGSGHSISGRRSAQGGRLGQNCAPQSCKKRNSGLFRWGSPLAVMTGSGHLINGSGPLDGHFSTRTLTVSRLRPGTGLPVAVSGSDGSGHSISGRRSAQGGRLGQNCAPQSCKKRNSGLFRWGSPLAVMTGSGHLINGSGPLDGHFSTRTLTVSRLRPGTGLPVAVSGSDGSGHSISGRRSAQGGRLGQNCAPQSCKKRNSGLFRWGSPLAVMTGSGHLINGSGPLDGHFSTRTLTVSRLRPGTGLPVAVSGSDGSGHSISGRRSAQGGRLGQNCAPQSCKKRNSSAIERGLTGTREFELTT